MSAFDPKRTWGRSLPNLVLAATMLCPQPSGEAMRRREFEISRRQVIRDAVAAAASTLGAPSVQAQKDQQTLRFVPQADLKILDPIWTTAYITRNHGYLVYDTLFGTDEQSQVRPQMVDRTSVSPDGLKYTFTLRDGLRWHDQQPVLSEDCVESLKRWGKKDRSASSSWRIREKLRQSIGKHSRSNSPNASVPSSKRWASRRATYLS